VLVTGASGGLGSATVTRLGDLGWQVFAGVRSREAGEELALGRPTVTPVELDICDENTVAAARSRIDGDLAGRGLDALVNNAGLVVQGPLELVPLHALRRQFEVNVIGQMAVTQAFLPLLRAGRGRVVNITGAAGRVTVPMLGAISASKAALESASDALRMELKHQGVRVSIVTPGLLRTQLHEKSTESARRDGYAGSAESQRIYAEALRQLEEKLRTAKESPVEMAVAAIVKALTAERPAPRYVVGRDAKQLLLLERLPERLRDRLLMWNRGLTPDVFRPARW
jgi:NAD(P)-dependent dehydrogenase (short-subunit alcohol dehydrogenase family)